MTFYIFIYLKMKLMNFCFTCALIFMMGSLDLIHTEPNPKPKMETPYLNQARRADEMVKDASNHFRITFASDVEFPNGFQSEYRTNILFIIDKDSKSTLPNEKITFIAGYEYEIYINSTIGEEGLQYYFSAREESKLKPIKSVDVILPYSSSVKSLESMFDGCSSLESVSLEYIDTSSVESFQSMFRGCSSLKSLDFSHFYTPKLTNMNNMFSGCSSLEFLDLSYFDTSSVYQMNNMFFQCSKLKILDISSFNMKIADKKGVTFPLPNLKYINLYNVEDTKSIISESYLQNIINLTVCQKEELVKGNNYYNSCCYYNIATNSCESGNYMIIYYDKDAVYENGFSFTENSDADKYRKDEYFIINKDYFNKKNKDETLVVSKGSKLEIYFTSKVTSLQNYFSSEYDTNAKNIAKVDFSHLDISSVDSTASMFYGCSNLKSVEYINKETSALTNMNSMFYQCTSLEDVELSYLNTSLVTDMSYMFEGCEKIELIDLSYFDTSSVSDMTEMFSGCKNLIYLDISNFNFENVENVENIFYGNENMKYINLYNARYNFTRPREELNDLSSVNDDLIVCQKEKIIITQGDYYYDEDGYYYHYDSDDCYYFNTSNHSDTESRNYIIIYFGKDTIYEKGFINDNNGKIIREAKDIDFIINGKHTIKYKATDRLFISKGKKIEIYFSNITNLENYFSATKDPNMKNVVSMDLSHFNTSFVTNMASMFNGCTSLKSIDLYDINTSLVTDINNMFNNCKELEVLDLSSFDTSLVTNMAYMFNECESLIYLDISNFNLEKITNFTSVFNGVDNLQYVNLYYVKNSNEYITNSELNDLEEVTVCQKGYLVTNENATFNCCYYDIKEKKCLNNNFAVIYFDYFDITYYEDEVFENDYREGISFIINRDRNSPLSGNDPFTVKRGHKIEIYFSSNITNLKSYFDSDYDYGMKYVISIDLSNLNTSSVINMAYLVYGCNSLKSIDLSNIDTSSVQYMYGMFENCSLLESIDLSYFNTSLVEDISYMFYGCSSLKVIDLSYFNTSKVKEIYSMFSDCNSLQLLDISHFNLENIDYSNYYKYNYDPMFFSNSNLTYINLYYVQDSKGLLDYEINTVLEKANLIVCQKENIVSDITNNRCCYYNITSQECGNQNYIEIFFGDEVIYNNGFENGLDNTKFREGIDFIINGEDHDKIINGNDKLYLHRGSKLEIYFSSDTLSLQNYFSADKDANMKNLVSVYLSNLNSTISGNLDNMFYGCESLKTVIDLNDIKTEPIVNMSYMFYKCSSIEFIDLSAFNASSIQNMRSLFEGCSSLQYLDISHFNLENCSSVYRMIRNANNLSYINVYNVQDPKKLLSLNLSLPSKLENELIVCQKDEYKIISNDKIISKCCYYDMINHTCDDTNFITLYFGEDVEYEEFGNDCKNETFNYVINNFHETKLKPTTFLTIKYNDESEEEEEEHLIYPRLKIKKGHKFEIYIPTESPLETLKEYFSPSCDPNMKYLVSVDLSNFDTSKLTDMTSTLADCELLESVDFYNFKGSSIVNMNFLFSNCVSLKSIEFSHLEPTLVVYMNNMFSGSTSLESVKFSSSEATSLINLEEMFKGCTSIKSIDLSNFVTTSTSLMDYMFSECSSLKYLDISKFNMEEVTNANSMFEKVDSLKYINLFRAKDHNDYISKSELNDLNNLTVCQSEQILTKEDVINRCCKYNITTDQCEETNYIEIYYKEDVSYETRGFLNCSREDKVDYIIIGDKQYSVDDSFNINANTKVEIYFKDKLESLSNFFCPDDENTEYIVSIDLSYLNTSELKDISSMFSGCSSLNSVNILYFNTSTITNMNSLFKDCALLESVDLSNFETSLVKDMSNMFSGCSNLKSLDFSSFDTSSVVDMNNMFSGCNSIKSLDLSNFDTSQVTNFNSIFSDCTNLTALDISHFEFGANAKIKNIFKNVESLKYINLYYVVDTSEIFPDSAIYTITGISVCQNVNDRIVDSTDIIERCCYYNILTNQCENSNYIVVKFKNDTDTKYDKGFIYDILSEENGPREGKIDFIIYNNKKYLPNETLTIKANSEIEIYLTNITSLESFFDFFSDTNVENIISVDFSHLDASNITDLSYLFQDCSNLLSVDFSNFNSSSLITMQSMLYGCESITSINLTNFNTSLVIDMSYLFEGCSDLQFIYLSNLNTSKVENMVHMFSDCSKLISLDLSYFDTSSLTGVKYMFSGCKSLKVLDISNFNLDNITESENYEYMFSNMENLKYINLYNVEDKNGIIKGSTDITNINNLIVCEKEDEIVLPIEEGKRTRKCCYFNISGETCDYDNYILIYYRKETSYKNGFNNNYRNNVDFIINVDYINTLSNDEDFIVKPGCKIGVYFKSSDIKTLESFFDYNHDINIGNIKSIDLSHFKSSLSVNMYKTFFGCTSLESITFNTLLTGNMSNMFYKCNSLKSLDLSHLDITQANDMSYMFYKCDSLESLDLPLSETSKVSDTSYMFYDCYSLGSINLTYLDVSKVTDMSYMFYGCSSLKSVNTSNLVITNVKKMDHMFYNCSSLESSIEFSQYKSSPLTDLEQMFYGCGNLTSISLSKFDTSLVTSMKELFYGCDNLKYIDISNFNMTSCESYSDMFNDTQFVIFINIFNLTNDKIISKTFQTIDRLFFVCQSEVIIKNKKAYNCCEFNFEINECDFYPTTIVTTIMKESTFINLESTSNTEFLDNKMSTDAELMTTDFSKKLDTTFIKETTESIAKTSNIPGETEGFTDIVSAINKEPTTFITQETTQIESTLLEEKVESTTNYPKETTNVPDILFNTSNIDTTQINKPSTNPLFDTTTLNEETTHLTSKSSTQSISTNENEIITTNKFETTNIPELKTTSFNEIATSIIKETTGSITKSSNIIPSTSIFAENIPTTSLHKETTEVPSTTPFENQPTTYNVASTTKEEITTTEDNVQKTTSEKEEIKTSNLEIESTTQSNIDTTGPTTTKVDTTQANIDTTGYSTSKHDILESTTNVNEPTTAKEDIEETTTSEPKQESSTSEPKQEQTTSEPMQEPTTSEPKEEPSTSEPNQEPSTSEHKPEHTTTDEPKQEPSTSEPMQEPSTSEPKEEPTTSESKEEPSTSEPKQEPSTSEPKEEPTTSEPKQEPTTSEPKEEPTTSEPKQEPSTSEPKEEPTTSEPKQEPSTSESKEETTTSEPKQEPTTSEPKQEPTTSEPKEEPTTSEPKEEPTTSEPKQEPSTSEPKPEPTTSEPKPEPTTSEPKPEPTTSEPKPEPTTSEPKHEPTTSEPKHEPSTSEANNTDNYIITTLINNLKTESILTTIPNHINFTSIASTEPKIPTTIMESKIKTTIITDYESATVILVGFSRFLNYNTYFTFYIHFVSIRGFIFSNSVTIIVRFVYNRLLRILQEQEAFCEKVGDDLENVAYRCNATGNVSTVNSIQIEPVFNFSSQDVKIVGISPMAHTFMDNIQNATGDNDDLLNSNYYILDHANISENKRYNIFNISGIISDQKPNFTTNDLLLKVNAEKDTIEADVNCTIVEINGSNYTLNCTGEKNILYDLQSAISIIDNDVLIVNFDENATSEIKFGSNWNRFRREGSSGMSGGIIALIVIVLLAALVAIITLVLLRKKIFRKQHEDAQESTVYNLNA